MNRGAVHPLFAAAFSLARRGCRQLGLARPAARPPCERDADLVAGRIRALLEGVRPAMIARFGSNELNALANWQAIRRGPGDWLACVRGDCAPWWWEPGILRNLSQMAGVFPPGPQAAASFCGRVLEDLPLVDLLGSWLPQERLFEAAMPDCIRVEIELLNPYFAQLPWTRALEGRRVLVIHPFATTVRRQYARRLEIFPDGLLPAFELRTIRAVQALAGEPTAHADWLTALADMQRQMEAQEFDIALIGCGAFGLPLAAHAKRLGKIGFHLGGSLQLLFGIRGARWEKRDYNPHYDFTRLINPAWVRPSDDERPRRAASVEGACYW